MFETAGEGTPPVRSSAFVVPPERGTTGAGGEDACHFERHQSPCLFALHARLLSHREERKEVKNQNEFTIGFGLFASFAHFVLKLI
jgi:hypothetical protein